LDKLQEDVNRLGMQFAEHVSKYSGLSVETILALDAQSFHSEKAKEIGLINEIMTPREFLNYLSSKGA
jgi:ClpP class serine protease